MTPFCGCLFWVTAVPTQRATWPKTSHGRLWGTMPSIAPCINGLYLPPYGMWVCQSVSMWHVSFHHSTLLAPVRPTLLFSVSFWSDSVTHNWKVFSGGPGPVFQWPIFHSQDERKSACLSAQMCLPTVSKIAVSDFNSLAIGLQHLGCPADERPQLRG